MYDTIIIGGGIVGTAAAYELTRTGAKTLLVDRHDIGRATDAGAGILSFATLALGDSGPVYEFSMRCGTYYSQLIQQLRAEQEGDPGYAQCGEMIIAAHEDEVASFEHKRRLMYEQQTLLGQPAPGSLQDLSSAEARELFPPLTDVLCALYYRDSARVDGRLLTAAMRRAAEAKGLRIRQASVEGLRIEQGAVSGVQIEGEAVAAGKVIIAGGAWTPVLGDSLGLSIPVIPVRGQILHFSLPGVDTRRWPIVHGFHGHYLVSWDDSRVAAGATFEDAGFQPHTTAAGIRLVIDEMLRVAPGLAGAQLKEVRVGLRPLSLDGLPVIGPVPGISNVFVATGHGAVGLQMGPYSGQQAAAWALEQPSDLALSAFSPARLIQ